MLRKEQVGWQASSMMETGSEVANGKNGWKCGLWPSYEQPELNVFFNQ